MTLFRTAVSRTRSPTPAQISPRPVHEKVAMKMTRAIAGHVETGMSMPRRSPETRSEKAATNIAFTITGSARPRKSGSRPAGLTRMYERVCCERSPAIACVMAKRQGIDAYWTALPIT